MHQGLLFVHADFTHDVINLLQSFSFAVFYSSRCEFNVCEASFQTRTATELNKLSSAICLLQLLLATNHQ